MLLPTVSLLFLAGLLLTPDGIQAQEGQPYTLDQIEGLIEAGLSPSVILDMVRPDCLAFRIDTAAEERLRSAGATDEFVEGLRGVCFRGPEPDEETPPEVSAVTPTTSAPSALEYSPGSAALRSLAIPGLGQFYTGRPALGMTFLAAWAGAIGFGIMSQKVTVECLAQTTESCPTGQVRAEVVERPMLPVGLGAAVVVAVISAFEARSGARKANARQVGFSGEPETPGLVLEWLPAPGPVPAAGLVLLRLSHR
jgi:hypothetical protein